MSEDTFLSVEGEKTTFFLILFFTLNFIYFQPCCAFAAVRRLSLVAVRRLSCLTAPAIFPDQGSNPCLLHCKGDS